MPKISLSDGLSIFGIVFTIIIVVLDKAEKLKGSASIWLLLLAALFTLPLVFGNRFVIDTSPQWKWWLRGVMLAVVCFSYWAIVIWISPTSKVESPRTQAKTNGDEIGRIEALLTDVQDPAYRQLVAAIIHSFEPKANLAVGAIVNSPEGARKIDVEVRSPDGQMLVAVDIVDLPTGRKAGIEVVDAADSKRTDIKANAMLVCSNTGFDETAIRKAKRTKIGLISILRHDDNRIKATIEEEIYLRKVKIEQLTIGYTGDKSISNLKFEMHGVKYKDGSVAAWLQQKALQIVLTNPKLEQIVTMTFNLKKITNFEINGKTVKLRALFIRFQPQTQWLSQIVQLDATAGIYDYIRGRVRLAAGKNSYIIKDINFDSK